MKLALSALALLLAAIPLRAEPLEGKRDVNAAERFGRCGRAGLGTCPPRHQCVAKGSKPSQGYICKLIGTAKRDADTNIEAEPVKLGARSAEPQAEGRPPRIRPPPRALSSCTTTRCKHGYHCVQPQNRTPTCVKLKRNLEDSDVTTAEKRSEDLFQPPTVCGKNKLCASGYYCIRSKITGKHSCKKPRRSIDERDTTLEKRGAAFPPSFCLKGKPCPYGYHCVQDKNTGKHACKKWKRSVDENAEISAPVEKREKATQKSLSCGKDSPCPNGYRCVQTFKPSRQFCRKIMRGADAKEVIKFSAPAEKRDIEKNMDISACAEKRGKSDRPNLVACGKNKPPCAYGYLCVSSLRSRDQFCRIKRAKRDVNAEVETDSEWQIMAGIEK